MTESRGGVEELTPCTTVVFGVVDAHGAETLAGGGVGLVRGEDAFSATGDIFGGGTEFFVERICCCGGTDGEARMRRRNSGGLRVYFSMESEFGSENK